MPIVPAGSTNLNAIGVPNVYVQIIPPNPLLNGVPTDILGVVGTATWGPVNSPRTVGTMQEYIQIFGNPQTPQFDMGTQVYTASQGGANHFVCVRVTDGTDTAASGNLLDNNTPLHHPGAVLTSLYTGTLGNSINATIGAGSGSIPSALTYRLTVFIPGGIPEVYDNIGGTGVTFWTNLVNAVNMGQSVARGPSQLVVASLPTDIGYVTVTAEGTYSALPTIGTTGPGAGAVFSAVMKSKNQTIQAAGTGYASTDTVTFTGGTFTTPVTIEVGSVGGSGEILNFLVVDEGAYTVLPTNPVAQGSTSGSGVGATFNFAWGIEAINVTNGGSGYTNASALTLSGSGTGTLTIGSTNPPSTSSTTVLTGGTNGNTGVLTPDLIGVDGLIRTGMYALRKTGASVGVLADADDITFYTEQASFGLSEGIYMVGTLPAGLQDNIDLAITGKQTSAVNSYSFKLMMGDWMQFNDPFNNVARFTSTPGKVAGVLVTQSPENSSLNKPMTGIIATQKTAENRIYSDADLLQLELNGIDVVTKPIPVSDTSFGVRLGINTSSNDVTNGDDYTRMVNFLAATFNTGLGRFVGLPQTVQVRNEARATIQGFLSNLVQENMIGDVNGGPAFKVVLDATNNPSNRVALGYMQADVQVVLFSIIQQFVVNLEAGQSVQIQVLPPQVL